MSSKFDWRNVLAEAVGGVLTAGVIALIQWGWGKVSPEHRLLVIVGGVLSVAIIWIGVLVFRRVGKLVRLRPKLSIRVRDITCYVEHYNRTVHSGRMEFTEKGMKWFAECIVEVENRRRVLMTDITGVLKLVVGKEEFGSIPAPKFEMAGRSSRRFVVTFQDSLLKFPVGGPGPYLDGAYLLKLTYSCGMHGEKVPGQFNTEVRGHLAKTDWTGDIDSLRRFRTLGIKDRIQ